MEIDDVRPLAETDPVVSELELQKSQKEDSIGVIQRLRIKSIGKSRFCIPLCRLRCLPLVRPINEVDVARLENEFVMGYRDGDRAMYVSPYNNLDEDLPIMDDIKASWSPAWQEANTNFEEWLSKDPDLASLMGKMFFIWEGNH